MRPKSFFVSVLYLLTCAAAGSSEPVRVKELESPIATVTKYCDLDFAGSRLAGESSTKVEHLTRWSHPAEPAWDGATVVSGFNVVSSKQNGKKAVITVRYTVLGELQGRQFKKTTRRETVKFEVELGKREWSWKRDADPVLVEARLAWRIINPLIQPHISKSSAMRAISLLLNTQHERDSDELERTFHQLEALR